MRKQEVIYLTERASFRLTPLGVEVFEIAPGIDLEKDVLEQMAFTPVVAKDLKVMDKDYFIA
jgi:acyl CoA:acetate/3-ketoacid CoA transferase